MVAWARSLGSTANVLNGEAEQGSKTSAQLHPTQPHLIPNPHSLPLTPSPWLPSMQVGQKAQTLLHVPLASELPLPPPIIAIQRRPHQIFFHFTLKQNCLKLQSRKTSPWVWGTGRGPAGMETVNPFEPTAPARYAFLLHMNLQLPTLIGLVCYPWPQMLPHLYVSLWPIHASLLALLAPRPALSLSVSLVPPLLSYVLGLDLVSVTIGLCPAPT